MNASSGTVCFVQWIGLKQRQAPLDNIFNDINPPQTELSTGKLKKLSDISWFA